MPKLPKSALGDFDMDDPAVAKQAEQVRCFRVYIMVYNVCWHVLKYPYNESECYLSLLRIVLIAVTCQHSSNGESTTMSCFNSSQHSASSLPFFTLRCRILLTCISIA